MVSPGAAAFSPDGRLIVASTADFMGTSGATAAILWDAETGQEICRWEGREHAPRSAVFSPDGRFVYSVSADGGVFEWPVEDLPLVDLLAWAAENRYVRELTCEERALCQIEPLCLENQAP